MVSLLQRNINVMEIIYVIIAIGIIIGGGLIVGKLLFEHNKEVKLAQTNIDKLTEAINRY